MRKGCGRLHAVDLVNVCLTTTMLEIIIMVCYALVWAAVSNEHTRKQQNQKKRKDLLKYYKILFNNITVYRIYAYLLY